MHIDWVRLGGAGAEATDPVISRHTDRRSQLDDEEWIGVKVIPSPCSSPFLFPKLDVLSRAVVQVCMGKLQLAV